MTLENLQHLQKVQHQIPEMIQFIHQHFFCNSFEESMKMVPEFPGCPRALTFLAVFVPEFRDPQEFEAKILRVQQHLQDLNVKLGGLENFRIHNGVYTFNAGSKINLNKCSTFLSRMSHKYKVSHHNISSQGKFTVLCPLDEDGDIIVRSQISKLGSVRIYSQGAVFKTHQIFLQLSRDIEEYRHCKI